MLKMGPSAYLCREKEETHTEHSDLKGAQGEDLVVYFPNMHAVHFETQPQKMRRIGFHVERGETRCCRILVFTCRAAFFFATFGKLVESFPGVF
jgi:hypothetical protein